MTGPKTRFDAWKELRPTRIAAEIGAYVSFALRRFVRDRGMQSASSLTYTTLLSLVPLLAIAFAIFAAFPAFESAREQLEAAIFDNLVPGSDTQIKEYLNSFLANTGQLGTVGVVALGLSALLLLATIEATFNRVWRVERPRTLVVRFLIYWGVLTMGPLLIGAGITFTTNVVSVAQDGLSQAGVSADELAIEADGFGDQLLSVALQTVCFMILFAVVPNRRVAWRDALIGGFVSGAGFQILKAGFAWYLGNVFTYQTIYGAMAVFPVFLIWLYLSWCVVLLGAVFAASFPEWWRARTPVLELDASPARTLSAALRILGALKTATRTGDQLSEDQIAEETGVEEVDSVLAPLLEHGFASATEEGAVVLSRDLDTARVYDLYTALGLAAEGSDLDGAPPAVKRVIDGLAASERSALDQTIATVLGELGGERGDPA